jgi:hypothetical protein
MTGLHKSLLALIVGGVALAGAAGIADARPGGHHPYAGGAGPCGGAWQVTPEMSRMMEKTYNDMAPLLLELRAKEDELTAKIYGGADEKVIKELTEAVGRLQARVTEVRVNMQKQFAKAGVPLRGGLGCADGYGHMGGGRHGHGGGYGMGGCAGAYGAPVPYEGPAQGRMGNTEAGE